MDGTEPAPRMKGADRGTTTERYLEGKRVSSDADDSTQRLGRASWMGVKSILKRHSEEDLDVDVTVQAGLGSRRHAKFDEENIRATYNKYVCRRPIDEPKTPYVMCSLSREELFGEDAEAAAEARSSTLSVSAPHAAITESELSERLARLDAYTDADADADANDQNAKLQLQQQLHKLAFHHRRKLHYDEYHTILRHRVSFDSQAQKQAKAEAVAAHASDQELN